MPNWCSNKLIIASGSQAFVDRYTSLNEEGMRFFDFERIAPTPLGFLDDDRWYLWRISNWGTKWNTSANTTDANDDWTEVYFDTAWSPPIEALRALSEDSPDIHFELHYFELGCFFAGSVQFDGDVFSESESDPIQMALEQFGWDFSDWNDEASA